MRLLYETEGTRELSADLGRETGRRPSLARRSSSTVATAWLGWPSTDAATRTLVSMKTRSAAIVAVEALAPQIPADPPAAAALQHLGLAPAPAKVGIPIELEQRVWRTFAN